MASSSLPSYDSPDPECLISSLLDPRISLSMLFSAVRISIPTLLFTGFIVLTIRPSWRQACEYFIGDDFVCLHKYERESLSVEER